MRPFHISDKTALLVFFKITKVILETCRLKCVAAWFAEKKAFMGEWASKDRREQMHRKASFFTTEGRKRPFFLFKQAEIEVCHM